MAKLKTGLLLPVPKARKQADRSLVRIVKVHADKLGFRRKPKHVKKGNHD
jgi:hypothetical protein